MDQNISPELPETEHQVDPSIMQTMLRNYLQCPVCLDTCRMKPIYQCQNGHTICNSCIKRLYNCPLCRAFLGSGERIRNLALEYLVDNLEVSCPYKGKGCEAVIRSSKLKNHMLDCKFGKFVICPGLGFEECQQLLCNQTLYEHATNVHKLQMCRDNYQKIRITYVDFLSTKTLKAGGALKWDPLVVNIFPDTGPFLFLCDLDVNSRCTATFTCIYAPINADHLRDNEAAANEINEMHNTYYAEVVISSRESSIPMTFKWEGQTVTYKEYAKGSTQQGTFEIPLDRVRIHPNEMEQTMNMGRSMSYLGNETQATEAAGTSQQVPDNSNDNNEANHPPNRTANRSVVRRIRNVKQNLVIDVRVAKTEEELSKPWTGNFQQRGSHTITNYTVDKEAASFRGVRCNECKQGPLREIRFKCMECLAHDLCFKCRVEKKLHSHHVFMMISDADQNTRVTKNFKRMFKQWPASAAEVNNENADEIESASSDLPRPRPPPKKRSRTVRAPAEAVTAVSSHSSSSASNSSRRPVLTLPRIRSPPADEVSSSNSNLSTTATAGSVHNGEGSQTPSFLTRSRLNLALLNSTIAPAAPC